MTGIESMMVREGPVEFSWDAEGRFAVLRFVERGFGGVREAEALCRRLQGWIDDGSEGPFRLLVDCSEMVDVDAGWRNTWGDLFKRERDRATVGWFNASARIRLVIIMFLKGTGVEGRAFETEAEARDYLERMADVS